MVELRPGLPTLPQRMRKLPLDHRGFPVPWFVAWIDGKPDFRCIEPGRVVAAHRGSRCWLCGERMGVFKAFVIGPMCAVNRVSSEPPSHFECAIFAAKACPFLTQPRIRRNEKDMPEEGTTAGIALSRNPGVALVWVALQYTAFRPPGGGVLFNVGAPDRVYFFAEGREATRDEVVASIDGGLPILREMAKKDGPEAERQLEGQIVTAMALLPDVTAPDAAASR